MGIKNTQTAFGSVAKSFHWLSALIVLALLSVGFYMAELGASPFKIQLYGLHKSFGLLVLFLVVGRIVWRLANVTPAPLPSHHKWERILSSLIHFLLYVGLIGMPLSGWLMSSAGDFPAMFFGLFDMPDLVDKDRDLFRLMREVHEIFAYALIAAVGLHFAGAVKHHFIDRDETLQRMSSAALGFGGGAVIALIGAALLAAAVFFAFSHYSASAERTRVMRTVQAEQVSQQQQEEEAPALQQSALPEWNIDQARSAIRFAATQYGQVFNGRFERFRGAIFFDPGNLEESRADITIDITSIKTGSDDRDEQALDPEWFHTAEFTNAHFETTEFRHLETNRYEAVADLTIRGITKQVTMPFTLEITEAENGQKESHMLGTLTLNRLTFDVGQGQWKSAEAIGAEVNLDIEVVAHTGQSDAQ